MTEPSGRPAAAIPSECLKEVEPVTWWTPDGWVRDDPPLHYIAALSYAEHCNHGVVGDVAYEMQGYEMALRIGECPRVDVRHAPDGLFVQVWGYDVVMAMYFVAREHEAAFVTDKLPALFQAFGGLAPEDRS